MPDVNAQVVRYQYETRSLPEENVEILYLFGADDKSLAMVVFVDGQDQLPGPRETPSGLVVLTYRRASLATVIDMLRNEKPIYFTWASQARIARITTEREPVGEQEFRSYWAQLFG
jgi:hypothetical protein